MADIRRLFEDVALLQTYANAEEALLRADEISRKTDEALLEISNLEATIQQQKNEKEEKSYAEKNAERRKFLTETFIPVLEELDGRIHAIRDSIKTKDDIGKRVELVQYLHAELEPLGRLSEKEYRWFGELGNAKRILVIATELIDECLCVVDQSHTHEGWDTTFHKMLISSAVYSYAVACMGADYIKKRGSEDAMLIFDWIIVPLNAMERACNYLKDDVPMLTEGKDSPFSKAPRFDDFPLVFPPTGVGEFARREYDYINKKEINVHQVLAKAYLETLAYFALCETYIKASKIDLQHDNAKKYFEKFKILPYSKNATRRDLLTAKPITEFESFDSYLDAAHSILVPQYNFRDEGEIQDLLDALRLIQSRRRVSPDLLKAHLGSSARATYILSLLEVNNFIHKPEGTNRWEIYFDKVEDFLKNPPLPSSPVKDSGTETPQFESLSSGLPSEGEIYKVILWVFLAIVIVWFIVTCLKS